MASFVTKAFMGQPDWGYFFIGLVTLGSGIAGAVGESFNWYEKAKSHLISRNDFSTLTQQIRRLRAMQNLSERDRDIYITELTSQMGEAESRELWLAQGGVKALKIPDLLSLSPIQYSKMDR